jgi:DUF1680 family protein
VAHHRATGDSTLLDVTRRWADYLIREHQNGHPYFEAATDHSEAELALVRLYPATAERRHLDFSLDLIEGFNVVGPTVSDIQAGTGAAAITPESGAAPGHALHAVCVNCFLAGMAEYYLETGDESLYGHLPSLWDELVNTRSYVTGGMGSYGERISLRPHDLPHDTFSTYGDRSAGETCASVATIMFSWRMPAITGESRCFDVIENALHNHVMGALSLDRRAHSYYNPMRMTGDISEFSDHWQVPASSRCRLKKLNSTPCSLPTCWRLCGALPEYLYSYDEQGLLVNLHTSSSTRHTLSGKGWGSSGQRVSL